MPMTYLQAATRVLLEEGHPLHPGAIVEIAVARGYIAPNGRTPAQTMKARLSTHIVKLGESSPFMRTDLGVFGLRQWKGRESEYVAKQFRKSLFDEDILVFPRSSLRQHVPGNGLSTAAFDHVALLGDCQSMRRREAEEDRSVIQLVSVFVVQLGHRILTFKRTRRLPEVRLHDTYSVAFGGHINPTDIPPLFDFFEPRQSESFIARELREELRLPSSRLKYWGLLYDDSQEVSSQHLGIVYDIAIETDEFEIGERGFLTDARFETVDEIRARLDSFENWSAVIVAEKARMWGESKWSGKGLQRMS